MDKRCTKCGTLKPIGEFYLRHRRHHCRACHLASVMASYRRNVDERREYGRQYMQKRRETNPERERRCVQESTRRRRERIRSLRVAWRESHPELAALIDAALAVEKAERKAAKRAATLARQKAAIPYRRAQARRWHEAHPNWRIQYALQYRRANRARLNALARKREAMKRGNDAEHNALIVRFYEIVRTGKRLRCYLCGGFPPVGKRHVDHVVPLSRGGAHAVWNLACACATCNLKKGALTPEEYQCQNA